MAIPADGQVPVVSFKKRSGKASGNIRKRPVASIQARNDDSSDMSSSEDESGQKIKQRKKNSGAVSASSAKNKPNTATEPVASNEPPSGLTDAARRVGLSDDETKGSRSRKARGTTNDGESVIDGTYRGLANQTNFIKNSNAPAKSFGPVKAPSNVRTTTTTDYSPGICKDYKLTGFCGFGDSCIFLHDRTDYKQGWQLDLEWENATQGKSVAGGKVIASADSSRRGWQDEDDEETFLKKIPFACIICKKPYREPVVTRCHHYFCESCALGRYRKDPSCAACGAGTNGLFSSAKDLKKLLQKKRERVEKKRQEAAEAGKKLDSEEK